MRSVACLPQQHTSNRASPQASHPWLPGWSALITMQGLPSPSSISYQPFALNILIIWLNCNALGLACELPCIHRAAWLYIAAYLLQRTCAADQKHACICMPGEYVLANDWGPFSAPFVVAKLHGNLPAHHVCKLEAMTMTDVQRQLSWPWPHNRDEHITYGLELVIGRLEEDASIKIFFFIVSEFAWHWLNAENMVLAYDWYHIFICPPTKNIRYMP